jgi:hypothetical protein
VPQDVSDAGLRDAMVVHMEHIATYTDTALGFLNVGDDAGAEYSIRKAAAHFRFVVELMSELKQRNLIQQKEELYALAQPARRSVRNMEARRNGEATEPESFAGRELGDGYYPRS